MGDVTVDLDKFAWMVAEVSVELRRLRREREVLAEGVRWLTTGLRSVADTNPEHFGADLPRDLIARETLADSAAVAALALAAPGRAGEAREVGTSSADPLDGHPNPATEPTDSYVSRHPDLCAIVNAHRAVALAETEEQIDEAIRLEEIALVRAAYEPSGRWYEDAGWICRHCGQELESGDDACESTPEQCNGALYRALLKNLEATGEEDASEGHAEDPPAPASPEVAWETTGHGDWFAKVDGWLLEAKEYSDHWGWEVWSPPCGRDDPSASGDVDDLAAAQARAVAVLGALTKVLP